MVFFFFFIYFQAKDCGADWRQFLHVSGNEEGGTGGIAIPSREDYNLYGSLEENSREASR